MRLIRNNDLNLLENILHPPRKIITHNYNLNPNPKRDLGTIYQLYLCRLYILIPSSYLILPVEL